MQYIFVLVFLKAKPRRYRVEHFLVRGVRVHVKWRELAHESAECLGWQQRNPRAESLTEDTIQTLFG